MLRKTIPLLTLVLLLTSCAMYTSMMNADKNIRKLSIGMTEKEVIGVMGKEYEVISANSRNTVWGYKSYDDSIYMLYFEKGRLVEWEKEWLKVYPTPPRPHHPHPHS
ncbi:MAG: hypothetical protein LIP08_14685 [Bacteroides sp.]|nr:hypothetical protein [Bacteroides sp.]